MARTKFGAGTMLLALVAIAGGVWWWQRRKKPSGGLGYLVSEDEREFVSDASGRPLLADDAGELWREDVEGLAPMGAMPAAELSGFGSSLKKFRRRAVGTLTKHSPAARAVQLHRRGLARARGAHAALARTLTEHSPAARAVQLHRRGLARARGGQAALPRLATPGNHAAPGRLARQLPGRRFRPIGK